MSLKLFGIEILGKEKKPDSIVAMDSVNSDSSIVIDNDYNSAGAGWGMNTISGLSTDVAAAKENDLITQYRELLMIPEVDLCVEEIIQEAVIYPKDGSNAVNLNLDKLEDLKYSKKIKDAINDEFEYIYDLLRFNRKGQDIFKRWFVDSRTNYYKVIDNENPYDGIKSLTFIDPRKIKKVQESNRVIDKETGKLVINNYKEFFYYNEDGINDVSEARRKAEQSTSGATFTKNFNKTQQVSVLTKDSIAYAPSGINDSSGRMVIGYLHKALKTANNLQMMEDAMLIYKLSRAPERRVFYIDTGNLPKAKAEQYVKSISDQYKARVVYDSKTGKIKNDKKFNALTEDFWLPRSSGSKGTEISTLPGGAGSGDTEEVEYFKDKLYDSLTVPKSRFAGEPSLFSNGAQTTRDEIRFSRFIDRLRASFNVLFEEILGTQLILKNIIDSDEWEYIKNRIVYEYAEDNHYREAAEVEKQSSLADMLQRFDTLTGKWVSREYVWKNIMKLEPDEIEKLKAEMDKENKEELKNQQELENSIVSSLDTVEADDIADKKVSNTATPTSDAKKESVDDIINFSALTEQTILEIVK